MTHQAHPVNSTLPSVSHLCRTRPQWGRKECLALVPELRVPATGGPSHRLILCFHPEDPNSGRIWRRRKRYHHFWEKGPWVLIDCKLHLSQQVSCFTKPVQEESRSCQVQDHPWKEVRALFLELASEEHFFSAVVETLRVRTGWGRRRRQPEAGLDHSLRVATQEGKHWVLSFSKH